MAAGILKRLTGRQGTKRRLRQLWARADGSDAPHLAVLLFLGWGSWRTELCTRFNLPEEVETYAVHTPRAQQLLPLTFTGDPPVPCFQGPRLPKSPVRGKETSPQSQNTETRAVP